MRLQLQQLPFELLLLIMQEMAEKMHNMQQKSLRRLQMSCSGEVVLRSATPVENTATTTSSSVKMQTAQP